MNISMNFVNIHNLRGKKHPKFDKMNNLVNIMYIFTKNK